MDSEKSVLMGITVECTKHGPTSGAVLVCKHVDEWTEPIFFDDGELVCCARDHSPEDFAGFACRICFHQGRRQ